MPQVAAWHSTRSDDKKVHHDNSTCTEGNNIESRYRKAGTGGHPKCSRCVELDSQGK